MPQAMVKPHFFQQLRMGAAFYDLPLIKHIDVFCHTAAAHTMRDHDARLIFCQHFQSMIDLIFRKWIQQVANLIS